MVHLIIDSTADCVPRVKNAAHVVPLTVLFGDTSYRDGVDISHREFYEKLVESDLLPTTSQANPGDFDRVYGTIPKEDTAVVITVSAGVSGTYQSACIAAADYDNIHVVDSGSVAIGTGILAEYALGLIEQGLSAPEIVEKLMKKRDDVCVIAMLDTLEYLKKGGRISATAALAGSILNIKPVITLKDGKIEVLGKARGSRQGNNLLVQMIEKTGGIDFTLPILLGYTGLSDELLKKYMADSAHLWQNGTEALATTCIGSVIGTHAGPGAIAAAFFRR